MFNMVHGMILPLDELIEKYQLKISGVIHCGASIGHEAELYDSLGIKKVLWIEAIPDVFTVLTGNVSKYRHDAICACLSDKEDELEFFVSNNDGLSSSFLPFGVHSEIHPTIEYSHSLTMKTSLLKDIPFKGNFLVMDLQGAELKALEGLGERISEIDYIYSEVNKRETYRGCALIEEFDEYLDKQGFKRVETGEWNLDTWTDAFYIR